MRKPIKQTPSPGNRPGKAAGGRWRRGRGVFATAAVTLLGLSAGHPPVWAGSVPRAAIPPAGISTGVDGILFAEPGGGKNVWVIGHHAYKAPTGPKISCHDADTGTPRPNKNRGKSRPMSLNTKALPRPPGRDGGLHETGLLPSVRPFASFAMTWAFRAFQLTFTRFWS